MNQILNVVDPSILLHSRIKAIPIVHGSLEFSLIIKKYFFDNAPDILAIELPDFLSSHIEKALPYLNSFPIIEIDNEIKTYFIMESLEPIVESLRNAFELHIPVYYIDLFFSNYFFYDNFSLWKKHLSFAS